MFFLSHLPLRVLHAKSGSRLTFVAPRLPSALCCPCICIWNVQPNLRCESILQLTAWNQNWSNALHQDGMHFALSTALLKDASLLRLIFVCLWMCSGPSPALSCLTWKSPEEMCWGPWLRPPQLSSYNNELNHRKVAKQHQDSSSCFCPAQFEDPSLPPAKSYYPTIFSRCTM